MKVSITPENVRFIACALTGYEVDNRKTMTHDFMVMDRAAGSISLHAWWQASDWQRREMQHDMWFRLFGMKP